MELISRTEQDVGCFGRKPLLESMVMMRATTNSAEIELHLEKPQRIKDGVFQICFATGPYGDFDVNVIEAQVLQDVWKNVELESDKFWYMESRWGEKKSYTTTQLPEKVKLRFTASKNDKTFAHCDKYIALAEPFNFSSGNIEDILDYIYAENIRFKLQGKLPKTGNDLLKNGFECTCRSISGILLGLLRKNGYKAQVEVGMFYENGFQVAVNEKEGHYYTINPGISLHAWVEYEDGQIKKLDPTAYLAVRNDLERAGIGESVAKKVGYEVACMTPKRSLWYTPFDELLCFVEHGGPEITLKESYKPVGLVRC